MAFVVHLEHNSMELNVQQEVKVLDAKLIKTVLEQIVQVHYAHSVRQETISTFLNTVVQTILIGMMLLKLVLFTTQLILEATITLLLKNALTLQMILNAKAVKKIP